MNRSILLILCILYYSVLSGFVNPPSDVSDIDLDPGDNIGFITYNYSVDGDESFEIHPGPYKCNR